MAHGEVIEVVCEKAFLRGQPLYALSARKTLILASADDFC